MIYITELLLKTIPLDCTGIVYIGNMDEGFAKVYYSGLPVQIGIWSPRLGETVIIWAEENRELDFRVITDNPDKYWPLVNKTRFLIETREEQLCEK